MLVECRNDVAICGGARGVYEHSVTRAEDSGAMWHVVKQLLSNQFPLVRHMTNERYVSQRLLLSRCRNTVPVEFSLWSSPSSS